jgi:uncharacterized protein YyaL (SSP411 family)
VLDDYAFVIAGLLDMYQVRLDPALLRLAVALQTRQDTLFWDTEGGGYFTSPATSGDNTRILRLKDGKFKTSSRHGGVAYQDSRS